MNNTEVTNEVKTLDKENFSKIKSLSCKLVSMIDVETLNIYIKKVETIDQMQRSLINLARRSEDGTLNGVNEKLLFKRNQIFQLDREIDILKDILKNNLCEVGTFYEKHFLNKENHMIATFRCAEQLQVCHLLKFIFKKISTFNFGYNAQDALEELKSFKSKIEEFKIS